MIFVAGLTGPTGAGKSTAAKIFRDEGAYVVDCDKAAREVTEKGSDVLTKLAQSFGADILNKDGTLNRRLLASRAFINEEKTLLLNNITHPAITELVRKKIKSAEKEGFKIAIIDAPVLFSSPLKGDCRAIICVTAPLDERIERLLMRDNRNRQEILERISAQPNEKFYRENSDFIIDNSENVDIEPQCRMIFEKLCEIKNKMI